MDLAALNLIAEKHIRTALEEDLNHGDVSAAVSYTHLTLPTILRV